jgi:hypothetical protein
MSEMALYCVSPHMHRQKEERLTPITLLTCRPPLIIPNDLFARARPPGTTRLGDFLIATELLGCAAETILGAADVERAALPLTPLRAPAWVTLALCVAGRGTVLAGAVGGPHATDLFLVSQVRPL